ncbi:hypothetical protein BGZ65_004460 [Modicella reniformis]|uniref:F-box domain-containing protein n=1 Tax=Modicella reniformis TaxID=1440133 RepID=A0A9P6SMP4_9FUNG|nr:hypothetical protein BGZ65_004460 [Modicella reniformis]
MQPTHFQEIPELLSYVASFVQRRDLTACALVSKTWHQAFNPFIWHDVSWNYVRPFLPQAIHRHSQLVKTFKANRYSNKEGRKEVSGLRFPNLVSLDMSQSPFSQEDMKEWILGHSSVTRLRLDAFDLSPVFWSTLLGFRHLKDLRVWRLELSGKDVDTFWQLCTTHLVRLELSSPKITYPGNTLSMEFPSIKELKLSRLNEEVEIFFLMFMQRCPSLTSFWLDGVDSPGFVSSFSDLVAARTWSHFHSLTINSFKISSDILSKIIGSMQQITALHISYEQDFFASNFMELLRPHFSNIRVLHLRSNDESISPMAQEVLSSCPLLEQLTAPPIDASVVAEGKPWVCMRLQKLKLTIVYKDSTLPDLQPLVFAQLGRLVLLEVWQPYPHDTSGVLDLTLENGLGKLSTLRSLRYINFTNTSQEMGQQEIDWILQHWTSLEMFLGRLNRRDIALDVSLNEQLKRHGIKRR